MNTVSLTAPRVDRDFSYALAEVFHYIYLVELEGAEALALASALVERAQEIAACDDPDEIRKGRALDFNGTNRLMELTEYLLDFTDRRLNLLRSRDAYMDGHEREFQRIKNTVHMMYNLSEDPEEDALEEDVLLQLIGELEEELLSQGIDRLTMARAFVDCAFVYAKNLPVETFIGFCTDLKYSLGEDTEDDGCSEDGMCYVGEVMSAISYVPSSARIH